MPTANSTQTQFCENHSMICSSVKLNGRLAISLINIASRQRQVYQSFTPLCREDLVDANRAVFKLHRAARHIQSPNAIPGLTHKVERFLLPRFQTTHPVSQCQRVVRAQCLDIGDLEAGPFHLALHVAHAVEFAIGKNVAMYEFRADGVMSACFVVGDPVIKKQAAWLEDAVNGTEIGR